MIVVVIRLRSFPGITTMSRCISRTLTSITVLCLFVIAASSYPLFAQEATSDTSDGSGAYATGRYRNLFTEAGHSKRDVSRKIESAYQQLFHGDPQTQAIFFWTGKNANGRLAYVTDWNNHD